MPVAHEGLAGSASFVSAVGMPDRQQDLEEKLAFLQRHIEQQDRAMLELSKEVAALAARLARTEAKVTVQASDAESGPLADERPPHW